MTLTPLPKTLWHTISDGWKWLEKTTSISFSVLITVVSTWNALTWSWFSFAATCWVFCDVHVTLHAKVINYNNKNCIITSRIIPHCNMNSCCIVIFCVICCIAAYICTITMCNCELVHSLICNTNTILCKCTWTLLKGIFRINTS